MFTQQIGQSAEQNALNYLTNQGLKLVTRNYQCRVGEVDLIMRHQEHLVFIEVRLRSHKGFGDGLESITYAKKIKIIKTTLYYLNQHKIENKYPIRFDVVSIDGRSGEISWVQNAFDGDY